MKYLEACANKAHQKALRQNREAAKGKTRWGVPVNPADPGADSKDIEAEALMRVFAALQKGLVINNIEAVVRAATTRTGCAHWRKVARRREICEVVQASPVIENLRVGPDGRARMQTSEEE